MMSEDEWWIVSNYASTKTTEICTPVSCQKYVDLPRDMTNPSVVKINSTSYFIYDDGDAWIFNNITETFEVLPDSISDHENAQAGLVNYPDGRRYIFVSGGESSYKTERFNLDDPDSFWTYGPDLPYSVHFGSVLQYEDSFLIVGGQNDTYADYDTILRFDTEKDEWEILPVEMKSGRNSFPAFFIPEGYIYCQ